MRNRRESCSSNRESHQAPFINLEALRKKFRTSTASSSPSDRSAEEEQVQEDLESVRDDEDPLYCGFSKLQVVVFSSVLEEALDKIKILGLIGGLPSVKTTLEYQSLIDKYEKEDTQSFIFDPDTLEPYEGSLKKQMLIKFQKDRSYIEQVLSEAHDDLLKYFSINKFMRRLTQFHLAEEERNNLLKETSDNLATVKKLTAQLEKDKTNLCNDLQKKSEILGKLKDEYEDLIYENDIKYKYIDTWERARCAQNQVDINKKEDYFNNIIREYQNNYERENRINDEIEAYLTQTEGTHLGDIEMWMDKYDKDLETKELDIQCMKEKREEQITKLEELSKLYASHKKEIEDYLIDKEERRKQEELMAKMNYAATKIQAWWRGVMYRKGLGPYRKKRGKKGKGGQAKGKKK